MTGPSEWRFPGGHVLESVVAELFAPKAGQCPVSKWIAGLDEADQQRMGELLGHPSLSTAELVRVLRPYQQFSESSMRRHRNYVNARADVLNLCSCA